MHTLYTPHTLYTLHLLHTLSIHCTECTHCGQVGALATVLTSRWRKVLEDYHHTMQQGSSHEGGAVAQPQGGFLDNLSFPSESEEERVAVPRGAMPREGSPLDSSDEFNLDF